jgi:CRISPR-associated protein Csd1
MLLKTLKDYGDRIVLPPLMYDETPIKWIVDLDGHGNFVKLVVTTSGQKKDRGKSFSAPHALVTNKPTPKLIAHSPDYVLGIGKDKPKRTAKRHQAFLELLKQCVNETGSKNVGAVLKFLRAIAVEKCPDIERHKDEIEKEKNAVTFRVDGEFPFDEQKVQKFWVEYQRNELTGKKVLRPCMVCGGKKIPVRMHPFQLKGIPGGQTSGTALVSTNQESFISYGQKKEDQALTAPVCIECADRYAKAYNNLRRNERNRIIVGPILFIFWTREESDFSPASFFYDPDPEEVKILITSYRKGWLSELEDENSFYVAAFSGAGGRAVVRGWLESTVGNVKKNLARWFELQELVGPWGEDIRPERLWNLFSSLYRAPQRDMVPNVPRVMVKVALEGGRLPKWLLYQAIRRNRAEQRVTRPRMVLIKMIVASDQEYKGKEDQMASLDKKNREPGYLCGRLLAVLEAVQIAAHPGIKATIIDRYFGTASSAPATIFGTLLRGAQNHLAVLRKTKEGAFHALSMRLEEVLNGIEATGLPATLDLKEQALFSLGYYHQRAHDRAAAMFKKQAKNEKIIE